MRTSPVILLSVFLLAQTLCASEKFTDDCMAPDYKHQVVLRGDEDTGAYELLIRAPADNKTLFSGDAGGYASFTAATNPANFKCMWSPDSKFVAVFTRGTKRSGDAAIYYVTENMVQEIAFPDLMPSITRHLTAEMRALWVRPEVWLPAHGLLLSVEGTQMDEEHANFRFLLTLTLKPNKSGKFTAEIASFQQDHTIPFSIK